jgi:hypothetical protein
MDPKEHIFISHSSKDCKLAKALYDLFKANWPDIYIFYSEESIEKGEEFDKKIIEECKDATLGIIILSPYAVKSPYVEQEIGCLISRNIDRYYILLNSSIHKKMGFDDKIQGFKLYDNANHRFTYVEEDSPECSLMIKQEQSKKLKQILRDLEKKYSFRPISGKFKERQNFEARFLNMTPLTGHYDNRNPCALLESLKCAEQEIRIMGENSLQPIHGGFETLQKFLASGGKIKVLIADYNSPEYFHRETVEKTLESKRLRADWIATLGNLIHLYLKIKSDNKGSLEVKCTPEPQFASIVIIDHWLLQYNPYEIITPSKGESKRQFYSCVDLYLEKHDKFTHYFDEFEARWKMNTTRKPDLNAAVMDAIIPKTIPL